MKAHRIFTLEEYNPIWNKEYEKRALLLKSVFGDEIIRIEHIGSTSIPNMVAKPQIDIQIEVKDLNKIKNFYKKMEEKGFIAKGDYSKINEEYFIEDDKYGKRLSSIHIFQIGNPEFSNHMDFRDYLISHKFDKNLYIKLKRNLYTKYKDNYALYDNGKSEFIKDIFKKVKRWKEKKI